MPGTIQDLFGSADAFTKACADFKTLGFTDICTAQTITAAAAIEVEMHDRAPIPARAERNDATMAYSAGIVPLVPAALSLLSDPDLTGPLQALTGKRPVLSEDMSCITIYEPGDRLGPHLDQPADRCAVTCILYLSCQSPDPDAPDSGLQLKVYGADRASILFPARHSIRTRPGRLVLGRGSQVWHERPALRAGERVMALTACFGAA